MRLDAGDIRFTDDDGSTLIYWIESGINTASTKIWLKIPSIPSGTKTIYVYYGNPSATYNNSLGATNTFDFYDDFESGIIDSNKWDIKISYGSLGIRTDQTYGVYSIGSDQYPSQGGSGPDQNHYFMKLTDSTNLTYNVFMNTKCWKSTTYGGSASFGFGGSASIYGISLDNIWKDHEIILQRTSPTNVFSQVFENGISKGTYNSTITQGTTLMFGVQTQHNGASDNSVYARSDNIRVRKYISPEPTVSTIGVEECLTGDLSVSSIPSYATIYIDDVLQTEVTNVIITDICAGNHSLKLSKSGYQNLYTTFTITSGQTTAINQSLIPGEWLTNWNYRKAITISNSGSILTDYQILVTIDTISPISSAKMRLDAGDIRFTDDDGSTLIYWIESGINTASTKIWLKIPSIPSGTKTIYVYYGNPSATYNNSLGATNTFDFYDDFESGIIDSNKWDIKISYGSLGIRTDQTYGVYSIGSDQYPSQGGSGPDQNHYFMKLTDSTNLTYNVFMNTKCWKSTTYGGSASFGFGGSASIYGISLDNIWKDHEIILQRTSPTNVFSQVFENGISKGTYNSTITQGTTLMFGVQTQHNGASDNSVYARSDNIRVRKYISPEPTVSTIGVEELPRGNLDISSTPPDAQIWLAYTESPLVDQGMTTPAIIINLTPGIEYTYELRLIDYYPKSGTFTLVSGETITRNETLDPLPCPVSPKYSGSTVTLRATPRDGIGPYTVEFRKGGVDIIPSSRLESLSNPILNAPENNDITRVYTLDDVDIASSPGTIDFSVYITDSCPTGAKTCTETCTINIGCVTPVCNFTVT